MGEPPESRTPDRDFIRLEVYAIYKAITELFGEKGWQVIWRSGEIVFDDLEKQLEFHGKDPHSVVNVLANYLVKSGYCTKIETRMAGENILEYDVYGPFLIRPAIKRLRAEGAVQPLWLSALMVAALKKLCNVKAERHVNQPTHVSDLHTGERLVLTLFKESP